MAGREPDGSDNQEQAMQPAADASVASNNRLVPLPVNRDTTGCPECAAAKANAYKAGMALVAHMDELQKLQKKLKEKEDLLKVYSARDKYIDEVVTKNEQLEDDLSRIHIANTELKEKIKRQDQRIKELLTYERTYQEAVALKELNLKLKETLEKSEEQRESMKKKYQDSVFFAQERVDHLVDEVKKANAEILKLKSRTSKVPRFQEARQLILDLVRLVTENNLSSEGLRRRCERVVGSGADDNVPGNELPKRTRVISNHSFSTTSDDDDVRELENLMQSKGTKSEESTVKDPDQCIHDADTASTSGTHSDERSVKGSGGPRDSVKSSLNTGSGYMNVSVFKKKDIVGSKREKRLKPKTHAMDTIEDAHSKFLSKKINQGAHYAGGNMDTLGSSIIGKKTKTIKEQQLEMIAKHKEQKLTEASMNGKNISDAEGTDLLLDEEQDGKGDLKNGEQSSNFLDDFILSDSEDDLGSSVSGVDASNDTKSSKGPENGILEVDGKMAQNGVAEIRMKTVIIDDEKECDISQESSFDLEGEIALAPDADKQASESCVQSSSDQLELKNVQRDSLQNTSTLETEELTIHPSVSEHINSTENGVDTRAVFGSCKDTITVEGSLVADSLAHRGGTLTEELSCKPVMSNDGNIVEGAHSVGSTLTSQKQVIFPRESLVGANTSSAEIASKRSSPARSKSEEADEETPLINESAAFKESDHNPTHKAVEEKLFTSKSVTDVRLRTELRSEEDHLSGLPLTGLFQHGNSLGGHVCKDSETKCEEVMTGYDDELAVAGMVVKYMLDSLSAMEENTEVTSSISEVDKLTGMKESRGIVECVNAEGERETNDKDEAPCFCYRELLVECADFLLGPYERIDPYVPKPRRRKCTNTRKPRSSRPQADKNETIDGKKIVADCSKRESPRIPTNPTKSKLLKASVEKNDLVVRSGSTSSVSSESLLINEELLRGTESSESLLTEEELSTEVSCSNTDLCISDAGKNQMSGLPSKSAEIAMRNQLLSVKEPKNQRDFATPKLVTSLDDAKNRCIEKVSRNKNLKRLKSDRKTARASNVIQKANDKSTDIQSVGGPGTIDLKSSSIVEKDKSKRKSSVPKLSRRAENLGKISNQATAQSDKILTEKAKPVANGTDSKVQKLKRSNQLGASAACTGSAAGPPLAKKRREAETPQLRCEGKNTETTVLSLLDEFLVKKCRLEDILLKFRELASLQAISATDLALYMVKYLNNANTGKVPWSSLIGLVQKGKSLPGNLVELINQLSAECQWANLGMEFYRKLCITFVRSNQVFNPSRHLNIGCCLILTSRALSMDSELVSEADEKEIKVLLLESLKFSVCNHPSELTVPVLFLAQKFVPHLVKGLFCGEYSTGVDSFICELISVHLSAKRDYLSAFKSLWHETETDDPVGIKIVDTAEFRDMLAKRKDTVLNIRSAVDVEKQTICPEMRVAITSFISLFLVADPFLFTDKIDYGLDLLASTLSALNSKGESLYAENVSNTKERNINKLLLCAYILRGIRGMYRLNVDSAACLKKLAFEYYELHQDLQYKLQEQAVSKEDQQLRFAIEHLLYAMQA